tara:strand:+ start:6493 stop:6798 length:306 start_codon:yes stop_codon:yes gene_type:complete
MKERNQYTKVKQDKDKGRILRPIKYPEIVLSVNDTYVITIIGDRLDLMADQFYGDVRLWWIIAQANPDKVRRDSYSVSSGLEIRIPMRIDTILNNFKNINK